MKILYRENRVYLWCDFTSIPIVVLIRRLNTRRNEARRLEEEIFNAGAPSPGEQVTPLEEDTNIKQRPTNPLPLTDENIRTTHHKMTQDITTDGQAPTTQSQDMTTQANREVVHHPHQRVNTMAHV